MKIFISGGAKNGKSYQAQRLSKKLAGQRPLYYIATMEPRDDEDVQRIARHRLERLGWGFETIECSRNIMSCLKTAEVTGTFLFDSVTALLSNEMFRGGQVDETAVYRVAEELNRFVDAVGNIVIVSDYIYSDAAKYDDLTEQYRRGLALLDRQLVGRCDTVIELCAGQMIVHKGGLPG